MGLVSPVIGKIKPRRLFFNPNLAKDAILYLRRSANNPLFQAREDFPGFGDWMDYVMMTHDLRTIESFSKASRLRRVTSPNPNRIDLIFVPIS